MNATDRIRIHRLTSDEAGRFADLNTLFGEVFEDMDTYTGQRPDQDYLGSLLADDGVFALYTKLGTREEVLHFDIAVGD